MALPAIEALARLGPTLVGAPAWGPTLYGHLDLQVQGPTPVPRAQTAVLFPPSFRVAWQARHIPERIGFRGELRSALLSTALTRSPGHREEHYAALARAAGASPEGPPRLPTPAPDPQAPLDHVALIPVSPSGEPVMWPGFRQLADRVDRPVVYLGPGERWESPHPTHSLPLDRLMAWLMRARVVVSNDSGVSHLARALGRPTLVLHGSTVPARTGAAGSLAVEGPDLPCRPCYKKRCSVGRAPCLDIGVERVLAALEAL